MYIFTFYKFISTYVYIYPCIYEYEYSQIRGFPLTETQARKHSNTHSVMHTLHTQTYTHYTHNLSADGSPARICPRLSSLPPPPPRPPTSSSSASLAAILTPCLGANSGIFIFDIESRTKSTVTDAVGYRGWGMGWGVGGRCQEILVFVLFVYVFVCVCVYVCMCACACECM